MLFKPLILVAALFPLFAGVVWADYLIIPPIGTPQVWTNINSPPSSNQVPSGSQILLLPTGYTQAQIQYMQSDGNGNAVYVAPPAPPPSPPGPDVQGFIQALRTEPSFDAQIRMGLAGLLGLVQMDIANSTALQQDWNDAVNAYGSTWLTSSIQTTILNYASQYNISLVSK